MTGRILVAYATRTGSTEGVAKAIGETLAEDGTPVDVLPMSDVTDLSAYSAVVAGSAIRGGVWLPEAMEFVTSHKTALAQRPFAPFLVCITMSMKNENYRRGVAEWLKPVTKLVSPVSEGYFAGALDFDKLPWSFSTLGLRIAVGLGFWTSGDHRDWEAIRAWARSTAPKLQAGQAALRH
ncbi:MAG: flavodoxin domain-containing protein [Chloroflexi bacterium]|nr:flavodoxin domain-containing protein [Chloroflexota bacterium]